MSASKKDPAFLFYPKDWQDGTRSFYPAEKGIYIDLLAYQHQHGYIPADVNRLAVICGLGVNTFLPLWETVGQKFVPNGNQTVDQLVNERLMAEMGLRKENAHKNFVSGVFASLCKKSKASQSAIYKIKREFKVDDYTSFDREMVTERLTEWFTKRLPFLENENENGNEDVLEVNNSKNIGEKKVEQFPDMAFVQAMELNEMEVERVGVYVKQPFTWLLLAEYWKSFSAKFDGSKFYQDRGEIIRYFQNWLKSELSKGKKTIPAGRITVEQMREIQRQKQAS